MRILFIFVLSLIATCLLTLPSHAALNADNIMGMWLFNEGQGDKANDSSGNGNDGKVIGGAKWVDGQFGKALEFNGTDAWIEVQHSDTVGLRI